MRLQSLYCEQLTHTADTITLVLCDDQSTRHMNEMQQSWVSASKTRFCHASGLVI